MLTRRNMHGTGIGALDLFLEFPRTRAVAASAIAYDPVVLFIPGAYPHPPERHLVVADIKRAERVLNPAPRCLPTGFSPVILNA